MGYYSIVAIATRPVMFPDSLVQLDKGLNAFTVTTSDLEGFLSTLKADGVTVHKVNQLDAFGPVSADSLLLPTTGGIDGKETEP